MGDATQGTAMSENRILFVNGQVFDGTGGPTGPGDVVVRGDRIESVRPGGGTEAEPGDVVVDCAGAIPDVVYGDVPGYRPLELDLYLPEAASPLVPVPVLPS